MRFLGTLRPMGHFALLYTLRCIVANRERNHDEWNWQEVAQTHGKFFWGMYLYDYNMITEVVLEANPSDEEALAVDHPCIIHHKARKEKIKDTL